MYDPITYLEEWQEGWNTCKEGLPPKDNPSEVYLDGYSTRYTKEQNDSWFTERGIA